jgi:hypothetical protein
VENPVMPHYYRVKDVMYSLDAKVAHEVAILILNVLAAVLLSVATTTPLGASECIEIDARTTKQSAAMVFEGTITKAEEIENDEIEITMDVHRVWKGEVGKQATVHYPAFGPMAWGGSYPPVSAITWLKAGKRFVVFMNAAEGQHKLAQHRASWVAPCYGLKEPNPDVIKQLGRWRKPKETS